MKERLHHIDLLETIAIFFVILYHGTLYFFDITKNGSAVTYILYYSRTILSTCVPLFFFANGYLLLNREFDLKKHIKKTLRLILLTFIWGFILMPIYMLIARVPFSFKTVITSILNLDVSWGINVFWFLGALICIYLLFPALKALFDTNKKAFVFFTAACALLTFGFVLGNQALKLICRIANKNSVDLNFPAITMFNPFRGACGYSFVYFCLGGLICVYEDKILAFKRSKRNLIASFGIIISCACLFASGVYYSKYVSNQVYDVVWCGYDTVFTLFNVIFIYLLCLNYKASNRFIRCVSANTLGIYFLHTLFIKSTIPWLKSQSILCNLPVNLIYTFLIMCTCLLICLAIRKIPIINKLI